MTKIVALVQARMNSHRFPGKMLANLGGRPLLEWVLLRLIRSHEIDLVVLATSNQPHDNNLVLLAEKLGVMVFRGSEDDVLGRFAEAAKAFNATFVIRICADNPFVDPHEIDRLVLFFKSSDFDYCCNHQDRLESGYADGFGAEIFSNKLLQSLNERAVESRHREHATLYLWENSHQYKIGALQATPPLKYPMLRFDVDEMSDLKKLQGFINAGVSIYSGAVEIIEIAQRVERSL